MSILTECSLTAFPAPSGSGGSNLFKNVRGATTAALAANTYANGTGGIGATLTGNANGSINPIDGLTLAVADRLLVKNEVAALGNGIYVVTQVGTAGTPYILTRALDFDTSAEILPGTVVTVAEGTVNADLAYLLTANAPIVVGTTALTFAQFGAGMAIGTSVSGGTTGSVLFVGAGPVLAQDNAMFFWDDTNNFLGIGTATPLSEIHSVSTSASNPRGVIQDQVTADALGARLNFRKARGTPSVPTTVVTADVIGRVAGWGYDGSNYLLMAQISMNTIGTIAATRVPTTITFSTATDAAPSVLTTAMTIDQTQKVGIGTTTIQSGAFLEVASANVVPNNNLYGNVNIRSTDATAINIGGAVSFAGIVDGSGNIRNFGTIEGRKEASSGQAGYLKLSVNNAGTILEAMRISSTGLVGLGTTVPTHTMTQASTATGSAWYNTADQTTNYERALGRWSSNVFTLTAQQGGSGTARNLTIGAELGGSAAFIVHDITNRTMKFYSYGALPASVGTSTAAVQSFQFFAPAVTATSGSAVGLILNTTYNEASGTAANTDLLINRTQTAVGSGAQLLIDAQVASVSQFSVSNAGAVAMTGGLTIAASGLFTFNGRSIITSPSNGVLTLSNNAITDFTRLQFGGTTSSFPSIKRTTTALNFRLADDSADAAITTAAITASALVTSTGFAVSSVTTDSSTARTLSDADNGTVIQFTNGSAKTVTVNTGLANNFSVTMIQVGAGAITFAGTGTIVNRSSFTGSAGTNAVISLQRLGSGNFVLSGDCA